MPSIFWNWVLITCSSKLEAVNVALTTQSELVENLRAQLRTMEEQASSSQESLEALRASASSDANIASTEHEELLTAREDLKTIAAERDTLKLTHAQALNEAQVKQAALETKVTMADDLLIQVDNLKMEKEENAGKLSELEVEILELKETLEKLEYERDASLGTVNSLEKQLAVATSATQQASEETKTQAADFAAQIDDIRNLHKEQVDVASEDHVKVVASLEALKVELADVVAAKDLLEAEALATEDMNARKLEELVQLHATEKAGLLEEIRSITTTLQVLIHPHQLILRFNAHDIQDQEALYDSKVNAVKDQHNHLLQVAFERAKVCRAVVVNVHSIHPCCSTKQELNTLLNCKHFVVVRQRRWSKYRWQTKWLSTILKRNTQPHWIQKLPALKIRSMG